MNGCPQGHVCEVFGRSHSDLRCKASLNSDLLRENLYFFKGSKLIQFDSLFFDARFIVSFFSDDKFSIILPTFMRV